MIVYPGYFANEAAMQSGCVSSAQTYSNALSFTKTDPVGKSESGLAADCPYIVSVTQDAYKSSGNSFGACYYNIDVTVAHVASSLTLTFTSGIDQGVSNEAWGIGSVVIEAIL
jgi:hypothetical protein